MEKITNFVNDGFGWVCKNCMIGSATTTPGAEGLARHFREGEAESKVPTLAEPARARWLDRLRRTLVCPTCGAVEDVEKH